MSLRAAFVRLPSQRPLACVLRFRSGCLLRSRSCRPSGCLRQATQPAPAGMCSGLPPSLPLMSPFGLPSAGYPASARWHVFTFHVSGFFSPCRRCRSGVRRGDVWDGRSPSLRDDRGRVTRRRDRLCRSGGLFWEVGRRVFLLRVGVVDRTRAVEMFGTDGAHPSEDDRGRFP